MNLRRAICITFSIVLLFTFGFPKVSFAQPNNTLVHYDAGIVGVASSYNIDDGYRVVLVATGNGEVREIFYKASPLTMPDSKGESVISHFDGIIGLA